MVSMYVNDNGFMENIYNFIEVEFVICKVDMIDIVFDDVSDFFCFVIFKVI